jgi:hypothetical protein
VVCVVLLSMSTFNKKTGYKMANREVGYRGTKFSPYCFQRQLRDKKDDGVTDTLEEMKNCVVKQITFKEAQSFILDFEWLGTMGTTKFSYGVFTNDRLTAVYCFGLTAGTAALSQVFGEEHKKRGLVLVRGACAPWAHKHMSSFGMGKVLPTLHKERDIDYLIAYSDPEAGEIGTVYQATNWNFYGMTTPVNYLVRPDGKRSDPKLISKYAKKKGITYAEQKQLFVDEGYTFEKGSPKLKYFKIIGNKTIRKELTKKLKVPVYKYLKRMDNMEDLYKVFKEQNKKPKNI